MNTQAMAIPITEHEDVKKVFALYTQNGMGQEKADAESLIKHIAFMETQFEKVFDELQNVRAQLQTIEDKSVRATVTRIVDTVDTKVNDAKTQFIGIKDGVVTSFSNAVDAAKEKGVSALKSTVDFLKIHSALSFLKGKLGKAVDSLHQCAVQIEKVKIELHTAKSHAGNAGRLILGKDAKTTQTYNYERGILAGVQKLLHKTAVLLTNIDRVADSAMRKIESIGQRSGKTSALKSIREIKNTRTDSKRSAPERTAQDR